MGWPIPASPLPVLALVVLAPALSLQVQQKRVVALLRVAVAVLATWRTGWLSTAVTGRVRQARYPYVDP